MRAVVQTREMRLGLSSLCWDPNVEQQMLQVVLRDWIQFALLYKIGSWISQTKAKRWQMGREQDD